MTEKEKMLAGQLYNGMEESLLEERQQAKEQIYEFNGLRPNQIEERNAILKQLLHIGKEFFIEPPFRCDYGSNIYIGDNFYANYNLVILDTAKVTIGNHVMIGPNVGIYTAGHPIETKIRNTGLEYGYPITIEDNVWIGGGTIINPGVKIGANTTIGSGSVVTKDIPSGVIAVGNPCRVLRKIEEKEG